MARALARGVEPGRSGGRYDIRLWGRTVTRSTGSALVRHLRAGPPDRGRISPGDAAVGRDRVWLPRAQGFLLRLQLFRRAGCATGDDVIGRAGSGVALGLLAYVARRAEAATGDTRGPLRDAC